MSDDQAMRDLAARLFGREAKPPAHVPDSDLPDDDEQREFARALFAPDTD